MKSQHSTKVSSVVISLEIHWKEAWKKATNSKPKIQKPNSLVMRIEWQQGQNGKLRNTKCESVCELKSENVRFLINITLHVAIFYAIIIKYFFFKKESPL